MNRTKPLVFTFLFFLFVIMVFIFIPLSYILVSFLLMYLLGIYINYQGRIEYNKLYVKEMDIKVKGLKENLDVVYIADFQFDINETTFNHQAMKRVIEKTNNLEYDLLLLGGDFVNYIENIDLFFEYLKEINIPKMGCFTVLGNHDYIDYDKIVMKLKELGIIVVDNDYFKLNDNITIVGVEDMWRGNPKLPNISKDTVNILLSHNPDFIKEMDKDSKIDFMLSGHYHGGQIKLFGLTMQRLITKYVYGYFKKGNTQLYVTSGVGGSYMRGEKGKYIRFNARPEINKFKLKGEIL